MRHLFVPACLCLATFAGTTVIESNKQWFDELFGAQSVGKKTDRLVLQDGAFPDAPTEIPAQMVIDPQHVPLPPIAKPVVHRTREEVCDALAESAQSNNLPVPFFIRLLFQESRFQPEVVSAAGAEGVAQFMPETSADRGLENPYDPAQAIPASARLLRDLKQQFGNLGLAAAAYNAGPKRIQDWLAKKGKLPDETQGYVKTITGRPTENWKAAAAVAPEIKLPRHAPCQELAGLHAWNGPDRIPMPIPSPLARAAATSKSAVRIVASAIAQVKAKAAAPAASAQAEKSADSVTAADSKDPSGAIQLAARTANKTAAQPEQAAAKPVASKPAAAKPVAIKTAATKTVAAKSATATKPVPAKSVPAKPDNSVGMPVELAAAAQR